MRRPERMSDRRTPNCVRAIVAQAGGEARRRLTDLLLELAQCEKARSLSIHDRCKTLYDALANRRITSL